MTSRKQVHAAGLVAVQAHTADSTTISAHVTDGPAVILGRTAVTWLTDAEIARILAELAFQPQWAAAIRVAAADPSVEAAARGTRYLTGHGSRRQDLAARLLEAARQTQAALAEDGH